MKHRLINPMIIALITISTAGCSVLRLAETRAGHAVEKTVSDIEERRIQLSRRDFQLQFGTTKNDLSFHLQYRPYYKVERREIVTYKPRGLLAESILGLVTMALWIWAYTDSMVETGQFKINDEGELYAVKRFDWDKANPWQKAILIGVPVDSILWLFTSSTEMKVHQPWKQAGEIPGKWESSANQPLAISLSFPLFRYHYQGAYHTDSNGRFIIPATELIDKIPNLEPALRTNSIKIDTSTTVDGQEQQDSVTISRFRNRRRDPLFALFREEAELRRAKPADLVTQLAFSDEGDFIPNNILDAGERQGKLEITIKNRGQGPGVDVQLHLSSDNPDIQFSKTQTLGQIEPSDEKTVVVPITTSLQASDGVANVLVEAKEKRGYDAQKRQHRIRVAGLKAPRLTINAVEVNDKTLGNAVGNGNGIPENDETIELDVFIKNSGTGNALGTKLELVNLNLGVDVQVKLVNLGTIRPAETVKGVLRFHIPRTFAAEALNYKLRVTEMRGADSTEKADVLRMETQRPILVYDILPPTSITNDSSASFTITLRNAGKLRARNMNLSLSARNATVKPARVDLGMLEAENSLPPQPFTVTLPRTFKANQLSLNIQLSQAEFDGLSQTATYPVEQIAPSLEIINTLVADANGDGNIQRGEQVEFEVRVINNGELNAENTQLKFSMADSRIQIDTPERLLGKLAPNLTSSPERFVFTIPRAISAETLSITVEVTHEDFPSVEDTLEYGIYAAVVKTTTVTPNLPTAQSQTLTTVANKPPVIGLTAPRTDIQTVYSSSFTLQASASDDRALENVQVMLDDRRIYDSQTAPDATQQLEASNRRLLSFVVPLRLREGKNSVVITAWDNDNQQVRQSISLIYERRTVVSRLENPSDVDVDLPQGRAKNPDAVALVIGIGKYRDVASATYADRDAIAFREYLIQMFGYSGDRIFLLTNDRATYRDIELGLTKIADRLVPNRQSDVIVFYAGHGTFKMEDKHAMHYFVSYEADPNYPDAGYPLDAFYQRLAGLAAKSVTVFIDACFSGTDREAQPLVEGARSLMLPEMELPKSPGPVLASSASNQISSSYESQRHGLFTYYLLKGLRGAADGADGSKQNGVITLSELEAYTKEYVSKTARAELGRLQEPTLTGSPEGRVLLKIQ